MAFGPIDADGLEAGHNSDRGSERMRAILYDEVRDSAAEVREHVRSTLEPHVHVIEDLAARLLTAKDQTLSGETLTDALTGLLA